MVYIPKSLFIFPPKAGDWDLPLSRYLFTGILAISWKLLVSNSFLKLIHRIFINRHYSIILHTLQNGRILSPCQCFITIFVNIRVNALWRVRSVGYSKSAQLPLPQFLCLHINTKMILLAPEDV